MFRVPFSSGIAAVWAMAVAGCLLSEVDHDPSSGGGGEMSSGDETGGADGVATDLGDGDDGGPGGEIACGDTDTCTGGDVCCVTMSSIACRPSCEGDEVPISCDGPEDCGGGACCWGLTGGSTCEASADACTGVRPTPACHETAHCEVLDGTQCQPEMFVPWISTCR